MSTLINQSEANRVLGYSRTAKLPDNVKFEINRIGLKAYNELQQVKQAMNKLNKLK